MINGFLDELLKVAGPGLKALVKRAAPTSSVNEIPFLDPAPTPYAKRVDPVDATDRVEGTGIARIVPGKLGNVTPAAHPIDQHKWNRAYQR